MIRYLFLLFLLIANINAAYAYIGLCCGKCGGNMPLNIIGAGVPETHEFRMKISPSLMHMDGILDGDSKISTDSLLGMPMMNGNPTGLYMAAPTEMDMKMVNLMLGYSFTDDFFAGLMFMYQDNSMDMKFNSMMQSMTGVNGFTMESSGIADTMLMTKFRLQTDDPLIPKRQLSLLLGLSLPTGSIDKRNSNHPLAMRRNELLPYGMQIGSGTFDPTIGLLYQASESPYWWGANATYTARLYDNKRDYRLGDEFKLDLYGMYQLKPDFLTQLQLNVLHREKIHGEMDEAAAGSSGHVIINNPNSPYTTPLWDTGNSGKTQVMMSAGIQWQPTPLQIIDLTVGVPVYTYTTGPQLEEDYRVMLTWYVEIPTSKSRRYKKNSDMDSLGF